MTEVTPESSINGIRETASCADDVDINSLTVSQATAQINTLISVELGDRIKDVERVPIRTALGRTLCEDVVAGVNVPACINSAMDGFAIKSKSESQGKPIECKIVGTSLAGKPFEGTIESNQCIRIMTGAKMPDDMDTVIMQELVEVKNEVAYIPTDYNPGQHVRQAGEDLAVGQVALEAGKLITPAELGLLASLGVAEVIVQRKLQVAFFSTGDELQSVGTPLKDGGLYDSNRYTLHGMLSRLQVDFIDMGVIPDQPEAIRTALVKAAEKADVIITTGGVSVGEADYIKDILAEEGQVNFWKIAIKPGRPLAFGKIKNTIFFGLPGNPVAVMVTFYQFVQPALRYMMGQSKTRSVKFKVPCLSPLRKKPGRVEYYRGVLGTDAEGRTIVHKAGVQGSGILSSMSKANCFIVLPTDSHSIESEQLVDVEPFEGLV